MTVWKDQTHCKYQWIYNAGSRNCPEIKENRPAISMKNNAEQWRPHQALPRPHRTAV